MLDLTGAAMQNQQTRLVALRRRRLRDQLRRQLIMEIRGSHRARALCQCGRVTRVQVGCRGRRVHVGTAASKSAETRNPKPETNSNAQWSKAQNRQQGSGFGHFLLGAWDLFRVSDFGFGTTAPGAPSPTRRERLK